MPRARPGARKTDARRRIRRYRTKWTHHVLPERFKRLLPGMLDLFEEKEPPYVECEEPTMEELEAKGVPEAEWPYYLGYMKRMLTLYRRYTGETLQLEKTSLTEEYVLRGKDEKVLEQVQEVAANCLGIEIEMNLWTEDFYKMIQWQHENGFSWVTGGTGSYGVYEGAAALTTGDGLNGWAEMTHAHELDCNFFTWNKERRMRVCLYVHRNSSQTVYVTMGGRTAGADQYVGFKIVNATVFGCVGNGAVETLTPALHTLGLNEEVTLEARFRPGQDARFYINGARVGTITANLPSGLGNADTLITAYIVNSVAEERDIAWDLWEFYQKR